MTEEEYKKLEAALLEAQRALTTARGALAEALRVYGADAIIAQEDWRIAEPFQSAIWYSHQAGVLSAYRLEAEELRFKVSRFRREEEERRQATQAREARAAQAAEEEKHNG